MQSYAAYARALSLFLVGICALTTTPAHGARMASPTTRDARLDNAFAAFQKGRESFRKRRYDLARDAFLKADQLAPHPYTKYNLALALVQLGDFAGAWNLFRNVAVHPDTNSEDRADAVRAANELLDRIAIIRVRAQMVRDVCLDTDAFLASDSSGVFVRATDPGQHTLYVSTIKVLLAVEAGHEYDLDADQIGGYDLQQEPAAVGRARVLTLAGIAGAAVGVGIAGIGGRSPALRYSGLAVGLGGVTVGTIGALRWRKYERQLDRKTTSAPPRYLPCLQRVDSQAKAPPESASATLSKR